MTEQLKSVLAMILNALDRDAAEGKQARGEMAEELRRAIDAQAGQQEPVAHADDRAVEIFAKAMKSKMAKARAKGRGGWDDRLRVSDKALAKMLIVHLGKGNEGTFEDVANFAMMLYQRGADPAVLAEAAEAPVKEARGKALELGIRALESKPAPATAALVEALKHARLFIRNGVELGYITMPQADTPDPAHDTLPIIDAALAAYRAQQEVKP